MADPVCNCGVCVGACMIQPGIFAPGEAKKAAKLLGVSEAQFIKDYIVIDYWEPDDSTQWKRVEFLAPRKTGDAEKHIHDGKADWTYGFIRGECVFLKERRCTIHEAKPAECRISNPCDPNWKNRKPEIVAKWIEAKDEVEYFDSLQDARLMEL